MAGLPEGFVVCELPDAAGGLREQQTARVMAELEQFRATGLRCMGREYQSDYECKRDAELYRNIVATHSRKHYKGAPEGCDRLIWAKVHKRGRWMMIVNTEVDE